MTPMAKRSEAPTPQEKLAVPVKPRLEPLPPPQKRLMGYLDGLLRWARGSRRRHQKALIGQFPDNIEHSGPQLGLGGASARVVALLGRRR
jgi:hypothetical protein